ncbi:hypothetical protein HELRODRAFT_175168 [Helobdella robusta]|uniref:Aminopeptidase n=1 Tax=Helobdella robusta TaxID=6412 RepID=T1F8Y4_HELRO|nr:hypothetical protein HELRODRAFT_175168 [Helobdella robusta]ESO01139.1 hypothetical protein HELRODRAFT_175168 [Helobdella robusta]
MEGKKPFERLSTVVRPVNYDLTFKTDLEKFTFEGKADISVETSAPTKSVMLNSVSLDIVQVAFKSQEQSFDKVEVSFSKEDETVTFTFPEELKVGPGNIIINFLGELNDKLKGFYRSKYTTPAGQEKYAAVTQFEPTDARQCFPCWDEPAIKATFDITLVVPQDKVTLSNMPVKKETKDEDNKLKTVSFERSPIMSTYLLAMVVGEYDYVEEKDSDGVLIRVYTPLGKKEQGLFALSVATKTLPFYKNYFNIAYPLPKMDLIAIADFSAGAMENWGLITYRETALLIDESNSSTATKQRVALVVGHEIAHQWFGNLVTMEWWTHLWLNEGFASWIEYLCVDHCFPEFDIWTQFASSDFSEALNLDALKNSHPIEVAVGHPSEIDEIFDSISYCKGASVIRMLHDYIGDRDYRAGMHAYLSKHQYKNTFTEDLWESLEQASGKPINEIMSTWTKQMGYPVIKVCQQMKENCRQLKLEQQRFIADGSHENQTWLVPITICTQSSPTVPVHKFVLRGESEMITIDNVKSDEWVKLNVGGVGFYRVHYAPDMLRQLISSLDCKVLSPRDRLSLQSDLFALCRASVAKIDDVLKVVGSFSHEDNYTVWTDLTSNLANLSILYQYTDFHDSFKAFLRKLFTPIMGTIGWEPKESEGPLTAMLRSLVISQLGRNDDKDVVEEAKKRFEQYCNDGVKLSSDLRGAHLKRHEFYNIFKVYSIALGHGGEKEFESLLKLYKTADLQEEKVRILRALGSVKSTDLINKVLDFAIGKDVRSQDTVFGILGVTGSAEGRDLAWKFVKKNWNELHERYQGGFLLARLIKGTTEDFASEDCLKDIEEFFKVHPAPSAERNIKQSLENIKLNISQLERDAPVVREFLASYI